MAQVGTVKILTLVGTGIFGIGLVLHIVGLATPNWEVVSFRGEAVNYGLWKLCERSECYSGFEKPSEMKACEAFAIIGMLLGAGGLGLAIFHLLTLIRGMPKNQMFPLFSAFAGCLALGAIIIAAIIWGAKFHRYGYLSVPSGDLGYSFILSIIGGILMPLGGVLVIIVSRQQS